MYKTRTNIWTHNDNDEQIIEKKKFVFLNSLNVETVIQTFFEWIWREKKYFVTIVFDRKTQFISFFWKKLCKRLNTNFKFFTTWHSKTDEQTKNANANLKTYLRTYVNYKQNDWINYLFVAKFEVNNAKNATTNMKFFLATKDYISRSNVESFESIITKNSMKRREMKNANKLIAKLKNLREFLREKIKWIQTKQEKYVNQHKTSISEFRIKNMMMLNVRFQTTRRQNKSFDFKNLSSYRVIRKINDMIYELELSKTMTKMFSVFHSWFFHFDDDVSLRDQKIVESKSMKSKENLWEINEIMRFKINKRRNDFEIEAKKNCFRYLIKWTKHENENITFQWLNYTKVKSCSHVVANFHHKNSTNEESHISFVISKNWVSST